MLLPLNEIREIERIKDFNTRMHMAARLYGSQGFYVIPIRPHSKILPDRKTGINYQSASPNKKTIDKWFGDDGRYRGWNIGLACGRAEGIFAIDLDRHGDEDGVANWEIVLGKNKLKCPVQNTPTGGQHLITLWKMNLNSSTSKIANSIDTRGGDGIARSHIVAWPSVTEDGAYSWSTGGDVPEAPEWLTEKMGVPWAHKPGRGNEEIGEEDEEEKFSLSHVAAMLDYVDIEQLSYEEWLFVGQAINSQHPDENGLELWNNWSVQGQRYEHGECARRWPGFHPGGHIRIGSLIYFAKLGGYDSSTDPLIRAGDFDELIERMNENNAILLTGGKIRIVHIDDKDNIHIMPTNDFNTLMYNKPVTVPGTRKKHITEADIWMAAPARRECVMGMGFFPDEELWHNGYVNVWRGWGVEPKEGNWTLFEEHIYKILCRGDDKLYRFVLDWVADIIQDPMHLKGTCIVLHGKEGIGKGTFCEFVGTMLGRRHYKHVTQERHLTGNFNYHLMDALLVFADEVIYGGSRSTVGVLKGMVTEKQLVCERKGIDSFMYENRARLVIASNEDWFIPAGPESRRWLVLEVDSSKANDRKYFDAMYKQMESGGYEAMMFDLLARKIKSNLNHAIETKSLNRQRAIFKTTGDSVDMWMDHCIGIENLGCIDSGEGGWPDFVDRMDLYQAFDTWASTRKGVRTKGTAHFYRKVEGYGFEKYRPRTEGIRKWGYRVPSLNKLRTED